MKLRSQSSFSSSLLYHFMILIVIISLAVMWIAAADMIIITIFFLTIFLLFTYRKITLLWWVHLIPRVHKTILPPRKQFFASRTFLRVFFFPLDTDTISIKEVGWPLLLLHPYALLVMSFIIELCFSAFSYQPGFLLFSLLLVNWSQEAKKWDITSFRCTFSGRASRDPTSLMT